MIRDRIKTAGRGFRQFISAVDDSMWQPSQPSEDKAKRHRLHNEVLKPFYHWLVGRTFIYGLIWWYGFRRARPLMQSGRVRVHGLERFEQAVATGRGVMLVSNHPSLVEPMLLVGLPWRKMLFDHRYYAYSTPDEALFPPGKKNFFFRYGRCIPLDRSGRNRRLNLAGSKRMVEVLRQGYPLILFAEGGRTFKFGERGQELLTGERLQSGRQRQISQLKDILVRVAGESGCLIMTVYVDLPPNWPQLTIDQALDLVLKGDMSGVDVYFGPKAFSIDWPSDRQQRDRIVSQTIERVERHLLFPGQVVD